MCRLLLVSFLFGALASITHTPLAEGQDCRDDRGEPAPCPAPAPITVTATVSETPAPTPPPEEHDVAYIAFEFFLDVARPSGLPFTQAGTERAPELARSAVISGAPETVLGGLSVVLGARPFPWLRIPELRFSFGGGDYGSEGVAWRDGDQAMDASLGSVYLVRAELGGGFELPIDDFSIYAMGHVAIAGYFMEARLTHPSAGDLGVQTLAEDAWELGWTVGISGDIGDGIRLNAAYRHVHTGMESDQLRFGIEVTPSG